VCVRIYMCVCVCDAPQKGQGLGDSPGTGASPSDLAHVNRAWNGTIINGGNSGNSGGAWLWWYVL
jgi:hypothetical protein